MFQRLIFTGVQLTKAMAFTAFTTREPVICRQGTILQKLPMHCWKPPGLSNMFFSYRGGWFPWADRYKKGYKETPINFRKLLGFTGVTPKKTNIPMENPPFEDAFSIEHGDFPMSCQFSGVYNPVLIGELHVLMASTNPPFFFSVVCHVDMKKCVLYHSLHLEFTEVWI